ncbi:MAG: hypothetical protein H0X67_04190 [Acidobacteria bacterium]|nr:hypothetical protein [Acidobacteriota bacterium]
MSSEELGRRDDAFTVLRRFARRRDTSEHCELCSNRVAAEHQHLIEPATRRLSCVCDACAVLFSDGHAKYKRVPRDIRVLPDFQITDAQWDSLLIPIEMAFFYDSSQAGHIVALYPSPAGPTESLLPLETWQDIVRDNPVLARMEPDVEALVVNRLGPSRHEVMAGEHQAEYYILPIDECFKLVGLIRLHWKGLSGGTEVWAEIGRFFSEIRVRATSTPRGAPCLS